MTREELFRAVGEVREDQIEEAETVKKQVRPWRRVGALAACLALIVTATATTAAELREADRWKAIIGSFNPAIEVEEDPDQWPVLVQPFNPAADSGGAAAGGAGDMDGCDYSHPADRPLRPDWSTGVEIGELAGPGDGETMLGMSACLAWMSEEEILAQNTVIFRGTMQDLQYYVVSGGLIELYYTRALVEVTDSIRGDLTKGETVALLYLGAKGYMSTSISGPLEDLDVGSDAIFMPIRTNRDTGRQEGGSYFCYADLAELYLSEGMRYVFADTGEGLNFERSTYPALETAETLDEVAAYIRDMIGETERTQPAAVPVTPQTEPSETRQVDPEEADPNYFSNGPGGALELPGGAYVSE